MTICELLLGFDSLFKPDEGIRTSLVLVIDCQYLLSPCSRDVMLIKSSIKHIPGALLYN